MDELSKLLAIQARGREFLAASDAKRIRDLPFFDKDGKQIRLRPHETQRLSELQEAARLKRLVREPSPFERLRKHGFRCPECGVLKPNLQQWRGDVCQSCASRSRGVKGTYEVKLFPEEQIKYRLKNGYTIKSPKEVAVLSGKSRQAIYKIRRGDTEWFDEEVADAILQTQPCEFVTKSRWSICGIALEKLLRETGMSHREFQRVTGTNRGIFSKWLDMTIQSVGEDVRQRIIEGLSKEGIYIS